MGIKKKTFGIITIFFTSMIVLFVFWRLPSDWKEKTLFPISMPDVATTAVTNHAKNSDFSEKIWLHRVNSIERARIMAEKYKGFEIDFIWEADSSHFYVAHDPEPEIYLPLYQMFDSIKDIHSHYLWLDLKNLEEENAEETLDNLIQLTDKHRLSRKRIIVESMNAFLLTDFTEAGFNTSFYLPIWDFNPYVVSKEEMMDYAKNIDAMLQKSNVNYISSDYLSYRFIKKYFPDSQMLLWHLKDNRYTPFLRKLLTRDNQVKVVLIHEESEGYR